MLNYVWEVLEILNIFPNLAKASLTLLDLHLLGDCAGSETSAECLSLKNKT